jgi:hypothetical protein
VARTKEKNMKYVKILGLLAVAAAAFMGIAGTAAASPTLTSPANTAYTGTLHASSEGHAVLHNPIAKIECNSTVSGSVTSNGTPASGPIATLTFSPCTDEWHVTTATEKGGTLSVNSAGEVVSNGATVESTRFGVTCRYATSNTKVGTLTGGTPATMHINASIPFHSGSVFCGSGATAWTGAYKVDTPGTLLVD